MSDQDRRDIRAEWAAAAAARAGDTIPRHEVFGTLVPGADVTRWNVVAVSRPALGLGGGPE